MKTVRKRMIIGMFIIIGIMVCGCGMKKNNSDESKDITLKSKPEIVLNERQKEILEEVGLPTDAEELDSSQQEAIIAVDEMLTAVEKKYNRSFSYSGYVEQGPLESEYLMAYPSDGNPRTDSFEVRKTDNGYEDDYINVALHKGFNEYITKMVVEAFHTEQLKVYSKVTYTTLTETPSDEKMYSGAVSGVNCIYVDGSAVDIEKMENYIEDLKEKLYKSEIDCTCDVIYLKENEIESVDEFNYSEYTKPECYIKREQIIVNVPEK